MSHEEAKDERVKRIVDKEERKPIYIKAEQINSMAIISNHNIISNDTQLALRYLATQERVISHLENNLRLLGTER